MNTQPEKTEIVRWNVPFAEARCPSVSVITENNGGSVLVVVAPHGIDKYPKFLVRFKNVVTLLCFEEMCAFDRGYGFDAAHRAEYCAYRWIASPWLQSYSALPAILLNAPQENLHHYLIFGGDSIVEVVALGEGKVERIDAKIVLETKHEV